MTRFWITACNDAREVIVNYALDACTLNDAVADAQRATPVPFHGHICITDMDNNPLYPAAPEIVPAMQVVFMLYGKLSMAVVTMPPEAVRDAILYRWPDAQSIAMCRMQPDTLYAIA